MGQSSRSSSTLKKPFQTFKSFTPIQRTTSTTRMKYASAILAIACAVAAATADDDEWTPSCEDLVELFEDEYGNADAAEEVDDNNEMAARAAGGKKRHRRR